uniref:Retrovirus-related Pol polyprotein from transposon TNT 1-94 n=1 Tax=Cajanus cajan TaxID=3821 RepID=A0A151U9T1_CAJCA|nr:Retrovirus-related Pol polyprotein from transposon TNT 1-94 [Cajanus cajan]
MWFLGQGLYDHLTKRASEIDKEVRDEWQRADYQLVSLLWQSIEPKLMVHFRPYKTCYDIWKKARNVYANDIQRIYESVHGLATLRMVDNDLPTYLNRAQSTIDELKLMLVSDDPQQILNKLDNMFMVFILQGLHKDYGSVRDQILTNPVIPTVEELIDRLIRVPSPEADPHTESESSAFISSTADRGSRGRGRGRGRGKGGRGNLHCTYCQRDGHTRDRCYSLHGFPSKTANVVQSPTSAPELKIEPEGNHPITLSTDDYQEYLQLKATKQASSSITVAHTGNSTVCLSHSTSIGPWVLDSGASDHLTGNVSLFPNLSSPKTPHHITLADGSKVQATGIGQISPLPSLPLKSVLLVPGCPFNLISISKLTRSLNCVITFTSDSFLIQDRSTGQTIGAGSESHGLYYLQPSTSTICASIESPGLIHRRLGHPSLNKLKKMVPHLSRLVSLECESCQLGKHVRASFPNSINSRAMSPFDVIHSDVWGPSRIPSLLGHRYYVTFIDDFSRCTWIFLMKNRSELFNIFLSFYSEIKTQFGKVIRILRSDNAKEYFSDCFKSFMASHGILHQSSCPHTPQQNGVAERKHRHIVDTARTLLLNANAPPKLWGDAVLTAGYLINRMPSSVLNDQVPHSLLYPLDPLYSVHPRVFGCTCFVHDLFSGRAKLSARAIKCVFLGYSRVQKGYRCYSPATHRFYTSADVTFFEDTPYFIATDVSPVDSDLLSQVLPIPHFDHSVPPTTPATLEAPDPPALPGSDHPLHRFGITYERRSHTVVPPNDSSIEPCDSTPASVSSPTPAPPTSVDLPIALRKGSRSTCNPHPIYNFLSYHRLSPTYYAFVSAISSITIPKTVQEALTHPGWRQAMIDEMTALDSNHTWVLVPPPLEKSVVGCQWVFNVKVGPDGQVNRLKARLVANGYTQVYGLDYSDTFSPVAKMASVRLFLAMAAMRHWPLFQLDIKNAFLHGDLEEEIYMDQPPGFVAQGGSGLVCKLQKSLYGLKQSPRAWFGRFSKVIQEFGMIRCETDHSVFFRRSSTHRFIYLVVYVDDIVITGDDQEGIKALKQHLFKHFQTKDLGPLRYFLGIEVAQSKSGIAISQRKYALDILEETGLTDCKPVDTPMDPNVKLMPNQGEPYPDPGRYRRLVGKLNYLTMTRPDISFPVSVVSQFLNSPCESHWLAVVRILRYIKRSPGKGLVYNDRGHTNIVGYSDADWAGDASDRRSTSGYCVFMGGNLVSWKSKKQSVVARSSTEAEYRAMAHTTCELLWLKFLIQELQFCKVGHMELVCDNQSALYLSSNPVFHERTKHIEVDCHFIREKILSDIIKTSSVCSKDQLADIFTKSLRGPRITYICNKLDVYDIYAPA